MGIFSNSWVIGIITGIVSGLLVFIVTTFLFDNKRKREYNQHKKEANADVINALKPYIAEQGLPDYDVLCSLINSTSRKYFVNLEDMLTPDQVCEELIREIMSDVYVTSERKKDYAENVAKYKSSHSHKSVEYSKKDSISIAVYYKEKDIRTMTKIVAILFGLVLISGLCLIILSIFNPELAKQIWYFPMHNNQGQDEMLMLSIIGVTAGVGTLISALLVTLFILQSPKKEKSKSMSEKEGEKNETIDQNKDTKTER